MACTSHSLPAARTGGHGSKFNDNGAAAACARASPSSSACAQFGLRARKHVCSRSNLHPGNEPSACFKKLQQRCCRQCERARSHPARHMAGCASKACKRCCLFVRSPAQAADKDVQTSRICTAATRLACTYVPAGYMAGYIKQACLCATADLTACAWYAGCPQARGARWCCLTRPALRQRCCRFRPRQHLCAATWTRAPRLCAAQAQLRSV